MAKRKIPSFINPPNTLKIKVGDGGIPSFVIKRCQDYLESNPVDFSPYASRHLEQLKDMYKQIQAAKIDEVTAKTKITDIVMQLKSNGSMFHYQLISMISDVMLRYLENVTTLNTDFLDILAMYNKILEIIVSKKLTGNGGREGYALTQELHNACMRYYAKYRVTT